MKIPELLRHDLQALRIAAQTAQQTYTVALNAGMMGMGLDPREQHDVNLDTGEVTPAAPKLEE